MRPTRRGVAVGVVVSVAVGVGLLLSPTRVLGGAHGVVMGPWFPALLVALYLIRPVLAWPISAISVLVGFRYGPVIGFPIAMAGVIVTSLIPYGVARSLTPARGLIADAADRSEEFFDATGGFRGVTAARLAPMPAEVVSSAAGVGRVPVAAFVAGTAVGELPWTAAAVIAGHSMHELSLADATPDPRLVAVAVVAGGLLIAGPVYRHLRARRP